MASLGKAQEEAAALTEELSRVRAAEKAAEDYRQSYRKEFQFETLMQWSLLHRMIFTSMINAFV